MSAETDATFSHKADPFSIYDNPSGDIPAIPIGSYSHVEFPIVEGKVYSSQKPSHEITGMELVASDVGAELTPRSNGEHRSTVIRHKGWLWVGGALAAAMGLTAAGLGTAFAIEHHHRKNKR